MPFHWNLLKFVLLFVVFGLLSCNKKEPSATVSSSGIANKEEMTAILTDVFLVEGAVAFKAMKNGNVQYFANHYYNFILKKHNLSRERFWENYHYYSENTDELEKIFNNIIVELENMQTGR